MRTRRLRTFIICAIAGVLSVGAIAPSAAAQDRILVIRGSSTWTVRPNGHGLQLLAGAQVPRRSWPVWSPDQQRIAYIARDQIWIMRASGGGAIQITSDRLEKRELAWSPDGTRIAFAGSMPGIAHRHLFTVGSNGTDLRRITSGPAASDASPSWSPDSARLVFVRTLDGTSSLFTIGRGGHGMIPIPDSDASYRPDWSPNGRWIVYDDGGGAIHLTHPDGSAEHVIAGLPQHYLYPTWSPDGRWIAINYMTPRTSRVLRITPDGSRRVPIVGDGSDPADLMDW